MTDEKSDQQFLSHVKSLVNYSNFSVSNRRLRSVSPPPSISRSQPSPSNSPQISIRPSLQSTFTKFGGGVHSEDSIKRRNRKSGSHVLRRENTGFSKLSPLSGTSIISSGTDPSVFATIHKNQARSLPPSQNIFNTLNLPKNSKFNSTFGNDENDEEEEIRLSEQLKAPRGEADQFYAGIQFEILNEKEKDKDKEKTIKVLKELIFTEYGYIRDLEHLQNIFMHPLEEENLLTPVEKADIFSNLEMILPVNRELIFNLRTTLKVSDSFSRLISRMFEVYGDYFRGRSRSLRALKDKKQNPRFLNGLRRCESNELCRRETLEGFLIKPVQRLCRYPLLLKEYQKTLGINDPEGPLIQKIRDDLSHLLTALETMTDNYEKNQHVAYILSNLDGSVPKVSNLTYIREGPLILKSGRVGKCRYYYLFDQLFIETSKRRTSSRFKVCSVFFVHSINLTELEDTCFCITNDREEFVLEADSLDIKKNWVMDFKKLKNEKFREEVRNEFKKRMSLENRKQNQQEIDRLKEEIEELHKKRVNLLKLRYKCFEIREKNHELKRTIKKFEKSLEQSYDASTCVSISPSSSSISSITSSYISPSPSVSSSNSCISATTSLNSTPVSTRSSLSIDNNYTNLPRRTLSLPTTPLTWGRSRNKDHDIIEHLNVYQQQFWIDGNLKKSSNNIAPKLYISKQIPFMENEES